MVFCNSTLEYETVNGEEKYSYGLTFHEVGLIVSAVFGLISIVIASWLIFSHSLHYLRPQEQKHIIRILLMIPVYSAVSFLSYYYYLHTIYFGVLRDCYEAFAIASFFTLICNYIAPNLHDQKDYFRKVEVKNWVWPLNWLQYITGGKEKGLLRKPHSGLTWFNIVYVCVFQYCFIRVLFTIVSVISEHYGRYCEDSLSPAFAHIWVECFEGVSVSIAMYGLIQFYIQLRQEIAEHRPGLKLLCIKLVIFFSFWQTLILSFLTSHGDISPGPHVFYPDISIGIPALLLCVEMAIFAVLHIWAFPVRPYKLPGAFSKSNPRDSAASYEQGAGMADISGSGFSGTPQYHGGILGWRAMVDAFNPWDIIKATARGFRWLFVGARHRKEDSSYQHNMQNGTGLDGGKDFELQNQGRMNGNGAMNGTAYVPQQETGRNVSPHRAFTPAGAVGDNYVGAGSAGLSTPSDGARVVGGLPSVARSKLEDQGAWRMDGPGSEDSRPPSTDMEDRRGLLKYAGQPGRSRMS